MMPGPAAVVWVIGALTPAQLALLLAFIAALGGGVLIWIQQIHSCRGTVFNTPHGQTAIVVSMALVDDDTEGMVGAMLTSVNVMQSPKMRDWRLDNGIITRARIHSRDAASRKTTRAQRIRLIYSLERCRHGSSGQTGTMDTACIEAFNGDETAALIVEFLVETELVKLSPDGNWYVAGDLVAYTNGCLRAMCYPEHTAVDGATLLNSWMHLVLSDPVLVRDSAWKLNLNLILTSSARRRRRDHETISPLLPESHGNFVTSSS